jgi:hypothetical protein
MAARPSLSARSRLVRPNRQREGERGPQAHLALDPDSSPVQFHELLGQGQPKPRALLRAGVVPADLAEFLEDRRLILRRDPDPRVTDGNGDDVGGRCRTEADPPPPPG